MSNQKEISTDIGNNSENIRTLKILTFTDNDFCLSNKVNRNRVMLNADELYDYVNGHAEYIEEFSEGSLLMYEDESFKTPFVRVEKFHNLTYLEYVSQLIQDEYLQLIAENCMNLRELHLIRCQSDANEKPIKIGSDLRVATLQQMRNLEIFTLQSGSADELLTYEIFLEILTKVNLKVFKFDGTLSPNQEPMTSMNSVTQHHLTELETFITFDKELSILPYFKNLSTLTLGVRNMNLTEEILKAIAMTCDKLEKYSIVSYTDFNELQQFPIPNGVKDFSIDNCRGLTYENLKQILTEYEIKKFKSHNVVYMGKLEDFALSPYIEAIDLDAKSSYELPSFYVGNENLKELQWYTNDNDDDDDDNNIPDPGPIETCINLTYLNIKDGGFIPISSLVQLSNLQILRIPQNMKDLDWMQITSVLKLPSLRELDIHSKWNNTTAEGILNSPTIPSEGFSTNVKVLTLNFVVFEHGLEFLLNLFNQNPNLELICNAFAIEEEFLQKLIHHSLLPQDLKTISIWGFNINCHDLRQNFKNIFDKLSQDTERFPGEWVFFEMIWKLVLSRTK